MKIVLVLLVCVMAFGVHSSPPAADGGSGYGNGCPSNPAQCNQHCLDTRDLTGHCKGYQMTFCDCGW
uniref:Defensin D n=1 Tax=Ornithodoros turicata TaxID=34597 RepID=A0A6G6XDP4_9ACAR|nr:defensin D [Ornithodoros turicata]